MILERKDEREREGEGEGERERSIGCFPLSAPLRDQTHNLGMYPNQGLNLQPFGAWENSPTN